MGEPTTTASLGVLGAVGALGIHKAFPELDLSALVGSFGGAWLYVWAARDETLWRKFAYLVAGWIGGYFGAAEVLGKKWMETSGMAGFASGLVCVGIALSILETFQTGRPPKWMSWVVNRFVGRGTP